jgi:hypothetical protein
VTQRSAARPPRIVALLKGGPLTRREIEVRLNADTARVLREITQARAAGHWIVAVPTGVGTVFELRGTTDPPEGT